MAQVDEEALVGRVGEGITVTYGVRVFTVGAVATDEIDVGEIVNWDAQAVWYSILGDGPFYLIVGEYGSVPIPDPAARVGLNDEQQCVFIPAFFEYTRKFTTSGRSGIRLIRAGSADVRVQIERTSPLIGGTNLGA